MQNGVQRMSAKMRRLRAEKMEKQVLRYANSQPMDLKIKLQITHGSKVFHVQQARARPRCQRITQNARGSKKMGMHEVPVQEDEQ